MRNGCYCIVDLLGHTRLVGWVEWAPDSIPGTLFMIDVFTDKGAQGERRYFSPNSIHQVTELASYDATLEAAGYTPPPVPAERITPEKLLAAASEALAARETEQAQESEARKHALIEEFQGQLDLRLGIPKGSVQPGIVNGAAEAIIGGVRIQYNPSSALPFMLIGSGQFRLERFGDLAGLASAIRTQFLESLPGYDSYEGSGRIKQAKDALAILTGLGFSVLMQTGDPEDGYLLAHREHAVLLDLRDSGYYEAHGMAMEQPLRAQYADNASHRQAEALEA
jgi:hypothetical protein